MYCTSTRRLSGLFLTMLLLPGMACAAIWQDVEATIARRGATAEPVYYRALHADRGALQQALAAAPLEFTTTQGAELPLPMPDGSMQRFAVERSPIMEPALAARYPQIQTYRVTGIDDPAASGRLDLTPAGFHGLLTTNAGAVFIDPDGIGGYHSYYQQDYIIAKKGAGELPLPHCGVAESAARLAAHPAVEVALRSSGQRRLYRLAVAATGEYTRFFGGSVSAALAEIVTAINRVNQVYGRDVAIQFVLVGNEDAIIYTNPNSDPYTNGDGAKMLNENQANLDRRIGTANYDIGHVFSTGGGGIASVGVACNPGFKAQGVTGRPVSQGGPVGDPFYIDLVAHELGHQLGADHPFNGTTGSCLGGRVAGSAVEPGSGSTIMAYAGICGAENLQATSDATFHAWSIGQITGYALVGAGAACGSLVSTGNTSPVVTAMAPVVIPANTPFSLQGAATDAEGDSLSYQWDEMDNNGTATTATTLGQDLGDNPLFRSFPPKATPLRNLPRLSSLLIGGSDVAEALPTTGRTLHFRLTVRDGQSGVDADDVTVTVVETAGPFRILETLPTTLTSGKTQAISWDPANTNITPINCTSVDIDLLTFNTDKSSYCETRLKSTTANDGSEPVSIPSNQGTQHARIRVGCSDNFFFDINDADLTIINATAPADTQCISTDGLALEHGVVFNDAAGGAGGLSSAPGGNGGGGGALLFLPLLLIAVRPLRRRRPTGR